MKNKFIKVLALVITLIMLLSIVPSQVVWALDSMTLKVDTVSTVKVVFDANGGAVSKESKTVFFDETYGDLPVPTRDYYAFDGWYTEKSGGEKVTAESVVKEKENIYG